MFCIRGDGHRVLCVYRERSVRSPREAKALLREGCPHDEGPTAAIVSFLRALKVGLAGIFPQASVEAGRVALYGTDSRAMLTARHLADCHGLSYFDGSVSYAHFSEPSLIDLARCCGALSDATVGSLVLEMSDLSVSLQARGEDILIQLSSSVDADRELLDLLGYHSPRGTRMLERTVSLRSVPALLSRTITMIAGASSVAVAVVSRPHLRLFIGTSASARAHA